MLLSAIAVGGTGTTVAGGLALAGGSTLATAADVAAPVAHASAAGADSAPAARADQPAAASAVRRSAVISRSDNRTAVDPAKQAALASSAGTAARAVVQTEDMSHGGDPKAIASALLGSYGWSGDQFGCLVSLWNRESGWNTHAANPSSSAYGIPQALPGSKMASAGPDWQNNAETQIKWGLGYIHDRYGSPCGAWGHSQSNGWY